MFNTKALYLLIIAAASTLVVTAQGINDPMFDQKDLSHLGVDHVNNVAWDDSDRMWCVTEKGLLRYNGNAIEIFDEDSSPALLSKDILKMVIDGSDIWISYSDFTGVSKFDIQNGEIEHFSDEQLIPDALIANIIPLDDQKVILCSWGDGFSILDYEKKRAKHYSREDEADTADVRCNRIKDVTILSDDQWLITYFESQKNKSVPTLFDPEKERFTPYPIDRFMKGYSKERKINIRRNLHAVNFSFLDQKENLWIGTYSSLIYINLRDSITKRILVDSSTYSNQNLVNARTYTVDRNNMLWVSTFNSGVMLVDPSDQSAKYIQHDPKNLNTVATNQTGVIANDPMGNVWVMAGSTNASIYNPYLQNFELHIWDELPLEYSNRSAQNIPVEQMNTLENGTIYLSDGKGLLKYDPKSHKTTRISRINEGRGKEFILKRGLKNFTISGQNLYFSNYKGFHQIDLSTAQTKTISSKHYMRPLFTHSNQGDTLFFFKNWREYRSIFGYVQSTDNVVEICDIPDGIRLKGQANNILPDGRWLINSRGDGFIIFDPGNEDYIHFHSEDSLHYFPDETLNCSFVDREKGELWLGSASGVYRFDCSADELHFEGDKLGTENCAVNAIVKANDGVLWFGMNEQLFKWDKEKQSGYSYSRKFGLRAGTFLSAYGQRNRDGKLFFVARNGILSFDPTSLEFSENEFEITLDEIKLNDTTFEGKKMDHLRTHDDLIQLDWTQNEVTFRFAHNQFYSPLPLKFYYRLKGDQKDWIENGNSNEIRFAGLNYGVYQLEVKAIDSYNQETEVQRLHFEITPPFWETSWFYLLVFVAAALGVFAIVKVREKRMRKRQRKLEKTVEERTSEVVQKADEIKIQKDIIELKNQELTASITYAKRIQDAILPSMAKMNHLLSEAFVYYRPKEIVAGDFYWVQQDNSDEKTVFFAVADCTGHGVPGAIVSVICNNSLQRSLREYKCTSPDQILNTTRELVVEEFEKSSEGVKDGMDIALCKLIKRATDQWNFEFSGANNPLIVIREKAQGEDVLTTMDNRGKERRVAPNKSAKDYLLFEIKGDKQPIGSHFDSKPFTNHKVQLLKGDIVYLFSDGYHDQFGSFDDTIKNNGKKLKTGNFKKMLLEAQSLTFDEQVAFLDTQFVDWKGSLEQIDDVCVFGFKMTE